jgi:hypothetical protein
MRWFLVIVTLIVLALSAYVYHRLIHEPRLPARWRRAATAVLAAVIALIYVAPWVFRSGQHPPRAAWVAALQWISYGTMGFLAITILYLVKLDLLRLASLRFTTDPGRRRFLVNAGKGGVLAAAAASTGLGVRSALGAPVVERVEIPVEGLPAGLEGLRIAQVSDLHVGPTVEVSRVRRVVEIVNGLGADVVALTGDFVDGTVEQLREDVAPLGELRARFGVFFCTGNHEYFSGAEAWKAELARLGARVLDNRHEVLSRGGVPFVVAGVDDISVRRFGAGESSPARAIEGAPAGAGLRILLAHQPRSCFEAAKAGFDLQLSGHTHAGQFYPFSLLARFAQPYFRGLNRHDGRMWVYVNRGTGYWGPPVRFANPPEISLITLVRGRVLAGHFADTRPGCPIPGSRASCARPRASREVPPGRS